MAGLSGIADLGFHSQGMHFPPDIRIEMSDTAIDTSKTNISVAMEGQKLVKEIVEKASALFKTLKDCEVLNVEENGSKERHHHVSKRCQETLDHLKELFIQLRNIYEESKQRMPEVHHDHISNSGNIESLLPLAEEEDQLGGDDIMGVERMERQALIKEIEQRNVKIKTLIEKFRNLIQDLNLIVQLDTSQ